MTDIDRLRAPMSDKPYTNRVVKLVARAEYEHDMREAGRPDAWEEASPFVRDSYRRRSRAGLDALAAALHKLASGARP